MTRYYEIHKRYHLLKEKPSAVIIKYEFHKRQAEGIEAHPGWTTGGHNLDIFGFIISLQLLEKELDRWDPDNAPSVAIGDLLNQTRSNSETTD